MEAALTKGLRAKGWKVVRAHKFDPKAKHGFIDSQKRGMEVFSMLDPDAPLIVAESVWQYSHHVLSGLTTHRGPILTLANWSGTWPGLVGLLNLNASLTKAGVRYSTLWSENFNDRFFKEGLSQWLKRGVIKHDQSHVRDLAMLKLRSEDEQLGQRLAREFKKQKAVMGVFDEGCMGMFNAIIPDELLHPTGVFKERLSQSTLFAAMREVSDKEGREALNWLLKKGMTFDWNGNEENGLTEAQTLLQCKMYISAVRLAAEFGCEAIGIQYQQGLKDLVPASDLAEGLLNNVDRPPVRCLKTGRVLFAGEAIPHFNEADECSGLDALVTNRLWRELGFAPETTLHDIRWGQHFRGNDVDDYVWVFLISGAVPPAHLVGGYKGSTSLRQPSMYFRLGGGTITGISKPGSIVWSRIFVMGGKLHCDLGVADVVNLPAEETSRRWRNTTPQWPIMHTVLRGVTRDQMMARHKSNHVQVVYTPNATQAHRACCIKASMLAELGIETSLCGDVKIN